MSNYIGKMPSPYTPTEAHCHVRSISLPSRLHPSFYKMEKQLKRLKTWDSSDSASSLQIEAITELYNCMQELIGCPLTHQALQHQHHHLEKPLDMSVTLLDVCGSAREMLFLMKEHMLDLQSSLRRKGVVDSSVNSHIGAYTCFRKKARKDISKVLKALKTMESKNSIIKSHSHPLLDVVDHHLQMVIKILRELSGITISFFRKVLDFMCEPVFKKNISRGWSSLFSGVVSTGSDRKIDDAKVDVQLVKVRLGELDGSIRELEGGLDCLFRCLIQQRVSLLNLITP